jgi:filamentous hemagglutinin
MNKNRYRIIYNKARQMFMAVAENAKSQTKTSGQSTSSVATPTSEESFHQLWHVKALVASMSLWMPLSTVYAGMMADTGANAANRPVIGVGQDAQKQNVPVINIQTPNASGVSHNIYKEFDVPTQGAVLNNSRTGAPSSIVGSVAANPYLQTGEARIILNEVNSAIASKFEGNLEIAGQQADLIIANPAGINIKGGGFINANKAILTTGKPQLNADGSIKEFVVDQGKITVSANAGSNLGLGGATNNNANYIDLYTRALELNAQLYAKNDIQVITGTNTISADLNKVESKTSTATAPTVAIDVKALGGMYANNIYMVGTEKGLGVNNAGTLQAVNNLVITSAGKIEHSGLISSTSKTQGVVSITTSETGAAGDINSSGSINSNSMLNIDSANNLNVNAKDILINYGGVASSPMLINTKGNLNLAANTRIMNDSVGGDLFVDAANINLGTSSELKSNRGSATIQAQQDLTSSASARLIAAQDLNVLGKGKLSFTNTLLHASLGSINLQSGSSNTQGLIDIQAGTINAAKDLNLSSSGDINLKNLGLALRTL